jgi:type I restriction enzyme M protein
MTESNNLVQKLWRYCNVLRDDGLSYPDYVEQLTYLLFLKMADEQAKMQDHTMPTIPAEYDWNSLIEKKGTELHSHYSRVLTVLGQGTGMLGQIFRAAENKLRDPAKLRLLIVDLIHPQNWSAMGTDVKGEAYEGLLEKNAQDTKSGAGQYFTPRPVVDAIIECVRPQLGETVFDPACGTGGFLIAAHRYLQQTNPSLTSPQALHLRYKAIRGSELVGAVTRLAAMNLFLHGVGPAGEEDELPIQTQDSLADDSGRQYEVILTNPPFGKQSSMTVVTDRREREEGELRLVREDFWVSTSNKELNFLQHIAASVRPGGRVAVVIPDGVLTGSGPSEAIRRRLLELYDVHTLLKLPPGLFYAAGVNASVLFFDRPLKKKKKAATTRLWVYDLRTDLRVTLVQKRLERTHLDDFVACYAAQDRSMRHSTWSLENPRGRWRDFSIEEVLTRDGLRFDFAWLSGEGGKRVANPQDLNNLATQIMTELQNAMNQLTELTVKD